MLPVSAWPPGSPGRSLSPFGVPWLVNLQRHPQGMTIPKGVWVATCQSNAGVVMRVNMALAVELISQPDLITSIPPIAPLPMLPPIPCPPPATIPSRRRHHHGHYARQRGTPTQFDDDDDFIVNYTIVAPCNTGTVWSDGWNLRLCGGGVAMLIKVAQ